MSEPIQSEVALLNAALELPRAERAGYLDHACVDDPALRQRVEELLQAHEQADDFLAAPVKNRLGQTMRLELPPSERPGDKIGRYKLLQQIGEGGCGVVYMAEQEEPVRRRVALKVIKLGMDTKSVIARFEAERQALALMDHPNIAKVLDAGATETGRPYFVMELVRGVKITEFCDEEKVSTEERLKLFMQVCQAIQHAHQKGIIHRDIKPSNILVTINDGVPVPKVIDFGIAKATAGPLTDKTVFTAFEQFIGTPAYMSPEQAVMTSLDIDTRSDIYSLGVLLYELLTGKTPFDPRELMQAGFDEMRRIIREQEPQRPSTRLSTMDGDELTTTAKRRQIPAPKLLHVVRGDLDWIVMKCLEKERGRRYETVVDLATDLRRHLNNEPVVARPPSRLYRLQKSFRRNKLVFATGAAIVAALFVGLVIALWQYVEKSRAYERVVQAEKKQEMLRQRAEEESAKARQVAQFLRDMLKAVAPDVARGRDVTVLRELLDATAQHVGQGLTNQPGVEAELRSTIGEVYLALGEFAKAEAMQRETLRLLRPLPGEDQLAVADAMNNLGATLVERGNYSEAETNLMEALALRTKLAGEDSAAVAESKLNLGALYSKQGRLADSESTFSDTARRFRQLGTDHSAQLAKALGGLGHVRQQMGQQFDAETNLLEALDLQTRLTGADSLEALNIQNNLGNLYSSAKRAGDAEQTFRAVMVSATKFYGENHPAVARYQCNLAYVLRSRGKLDEAETQLRKAVAIQYQVLGSNHVDLAASLGNLANVLRDQNKLEAAEKTMRETIRIQETAVGTNHLDTLSSRQNLAAILYNRGEIDPAIENLRETATRLHALSPTNGARLLPMVLCNLATMLDARGHYLEAEATAKEAIKVCQESMGDKHPLLPNAYLNLALALTHQRKLEEAEQIYLQTLTTRTGVPDRPDTANILHNLADVLRQRGKTNEAEVRYQEAIVIWRKTLGDNSPDLARTLHDLADLLLKLGRCAEAEKAEAEAVVIHRKRSSPETVNAVWTLAIIFECEEKWAESEKYFTESIALKRRLQKPGDRKQTEDLAVLLERLATVQLAQAKAVAAESSARECLTLREGMNLEHWRTYRARSLLGAALLEQREYSAAEPLLVSGCDGLVQHQADISVSNRNRIKWAMDRLARLYEQTDRPEQAAATRQRLGDLEKKGK